MQQCQHALTKHCTSTAAVAQSAHLLCKLELIVRCQTFEHGADDSKALLGTEKVAIGVVSVRERVVEPVGDPLQRIWWQVADVNAFECARIRRSLHWFRLPRELRLRLRLKLRCRLRLLVTILHTQRSAGLMGSGVVVAHCCVCLVLPETLNTREGTPRKAVNAPITAALTLKR